MTTPDRSSSGAGQVRSRSSRTCTRIVATAQFRDRKSTRLNSSHLVSSYAGFCLKKKKRFGKHAGCIYPAIIDHANRMGDTKQRCGASYRCLMQVKSEEVNGRRTMTPAPSYMELA